MSKEWENILKGEPAFILGCGPSLPEKDLHLLDNFFTIGINHIFFTYDPTVLFWQDKQVWLEYSDTITDTKAIKLAPHVRIKKKYTESAKKILQKLNNGPDKNFVECKIENMRSVHPELYKGRQIDGFYTFSRSNADVVGSGALACQWAMYLGCSELILVGIDCRYEGTQTNFYGKNDHHSYLSLTVCDRSMVWLRRNCPLPIYNCGKVKMFTHHKFKDVVVRFEHMKKDREYFYNKLMI